MSWTVEFHDSFAVEFQDWRDDIQKAATTLFVTLRTLGPMLGRPHADTLKGSRHGNMKELRFSVSDGEWRVAYAFDPRRRGILLVGASKSGVAQVRRCIRSLLPSFDCNRRQSVRCASRQLAWRQEEVACP